MFIRAKFRCMSITLNADFPSEVRLLPVEPKGSAYPEGCEENKSFWEATPSGEMKVWYRNGTKVPLVLGAFYYIDMEATEEGDDLWKMWEVKSYVPKHDQLDIKLGLGWSTDRDSIDHAELEMQILNSKTFPAFEGKKGSHWSVSINPA